MSLDSVRLRQNLNTCLWLVELYRGSNHRSLKLVTSHVRSALCTLGMLNSWKTFLLIRVVGRFSKGWRHLCSVPIPCTNLHFSILQVPNSCGTGFKGGMRNSKYSKSTFYTSSLASGRQQEPHLNTFSRETQKRTHFIIFKFKKLSVKIAHPTMIK